MQSLMDKLSLTCGNESGDSEDEEELFLEQNSPSEVYVGCSSDTLDIYGSDFVDLSVNDEISKTSEVVRSRTYCSGEFCVVRKIERYVGYGR